MPIYVYKCPVCSCKVEKFLPVDQRNSEQECPTCKETMVLQVSSFGISFGDGFFKTGGY